MAKRLTKAQRETIAAEQVKAINAHFDTLKTVADKTGKPVEIDVTPQCSSNVSEGAWLEMTSASAAELATGFNVSEVYRLLVLRCVTQLDHIALERLAMAIDTAND